MLNWLQGKGENMTRQFPTAEARTQIRGTEAFFCPAFTDILASFMNYFDSNFQIPPSENIFSLMILLQCKCLWWSSSSLA